MKTQVITGALLLSASLLTAQTTNKSTTVRIKKIENINGIETTKDTSYTINGPVTIHSFDQSAEAGTRDGKPNQVVIVTDGVTPGDHLTLMDKAGVMDEQVERALQAAGVDGKTLGVDKMMVVNIDEKNTGKNGEKPTRIVVIKTIKITDATEADNKMLGNQTGISDNLLGVDQVSFYPNPSIGKFNLSFNLIDKGNTTVTILNTEGKTIYSETLNNFSGVYDKAIDISKNPKGVYFVRIEQGKHAQLKKIILE